jgi:hypothetical protein
VDKDGAVVPTGGVLVMRGCGWGVRQGHPERGSQARRRWPTSREPGTEALAYIAGGGHARGRESGLVSRGNWGPCGVARRGSGAR